MSNPKSISIKDYTYTLPEDRIAKHPLKQRDASKLLCYKNGLIQDHVFHQLPNLLQKDDLLVFNNTRVIRARLLFKKASGSVIEVFCLEPADGLDPAMAFQEQGRSRWTALVGNAKRWKEPFQEILVTIQGTQVPLKAILEDRLQDHFVVRFEWPHDFTFSEIIDAAGNLPIPPYLKRETEADDLVRYQTVYAQYDGSVAAPTAGLHFTPQTFSDLQQKGVQTAHVTLHVGAGTFRPVKSDTMADHDMHEEKMFISRETIQKLYEHAQKGNIIAVGTTSLRTIESIYWYGVRLLSKSDASFKIAQWDPYELEQHISAPDAFGAVIHHLTKNNLEMLSGSTALLIAPGYRFQTVKGLITNFHQPDSTLLLLVAAFIGPDWRRIYDHALANEYRFLSYGDSSVLFPG